MRQGDWAQCRLWIAQPNATRGATAHARYYGPFSLLKPVHRADAVSSTGTGDRGDAVDERSGDDARTVALVRQRRQLSDDPTLLQDKLALVSPAMAPDTPACVGRRGCRRDAW